MGNKVLATVSGIGLKQMLGWLAPDNTSEQLEGEMTLVEKDSFRSTDGVEMPGGLYVYLTEYPEEGLFGPITNVSDLDKGIPTFQERVRPWLLKCFGEKIAGDKEERNHRFLEESLELVQSCGCTASEAHQLVDYVFNRPVGEPHQEVGGVQVTLAALCIANGLDMHEDGETELVRIWTKVEQIRAKQAAKPKHSPLPA